MRVSFAAIQRAYARVNSVLSIDIASYFTGIKARPSLKTDVFEKRHFRFKAASTIIKNQASVRGFRGKYFENANGIKDSSNNILSYLNDIERICYSTSSSADLDELRDKISKIQSDCKNLYQSLWNLGLFS